MPIHAGPCRSMPVHAGPCLDYGNYGIMHAQELATTILCLLIFYKVTFETVL